MIQLVAKNGQRFWQGLHALRGKPGRVTAWVILGDPQASDPPAGAVMDVIKRDEGIGWLLGCANGLIQSWGCQGLALRPPGSLSGAGAGERMPVL